jgi:hypothetical protein
MEAGHSGGAGIIRSDEHVTFPPLPGDRQPYAGHPLPALRPYPRLPARQHQRGLDRALPPGPSRSARHPRPVTEPGLSPAGDTAADARQIRTSCGPIAPGAGDHGAESATDATRARTRRSGRPARSVVWPSAPRPNGRSVLSCARIRNWPHELPNQGTARQHDAPTGLRSSLANRHSAALLSRRFRRTILPAQVMNA